MDPRLTPVARALQRGRSRYLLAAVPFLALVPLWPTVLHAPLGILLSGVSLLVSGFCCRTFLSRMDRYIDEDPLLVALLNDPQRVTRVHVEHVGRQAHVYIYYDLGRPRCVLLRLLPGPPLDELLAAFQDYAPHALR